MSNSDQQIDIRRATDADVPAVLELARRSLGWVGGADSERFFRWKHFENPFGHSPMWVATDGARVVGFRTFLRWRFRDGDDRTIDAVRAVDTATDPEYQGRGIFRRLTLGALDELRDDGIAFVFNTPNDQSLPGYLKMGWSIVGRLPTSVMPRTLGSLWTLRTARQPASLWSIDMRVGHAAPDVFMDEVAINGLLDAVPKPDGISTARDATYLRWRYGYADLRYRTLLLGSTPSDGLAVFRLRRRGRAVECVLCDLLVPADVRPAARRGLLRRMASETGATYVIRLGGSSANQGPFVQLPRIGPTLTFRALDGRAMPTRSTWSLTLGDVELL